MVKHHLVQKELTSGSFFQISICLKKVKQSNLYHLIIRVMATNELERIVAQEIRKNINKGQGNWNQATRRVQRILIKTRQEYRTFVGVELGYNPAQAIIIEQKLSEWRIPGTKRTPFSRRKAV